LFSRFLNFCANKSAETNRDNTFVECVKQSVHVTIAANVDIGRAQKKVKKAAHETFFFERESSNELRNLFFVIHLNTFRLFIM